MDQAEEESQLRSHECHPKSRKAIDLLFSPPVVSEAPSTSRDREVISNLGHTHYSPEVLCSIADNRPVLGSLKGGYHE